MIEYDDYLAHYSGKGEEWGERKREIEGAKKRKKAVINQLDNKYAPKNLKEITKKNFGEFALDQGVVGMGASVAYALSGKNNAVLYSGATASSAVDMQRTAKVLKDYRRLDKKTLARARRSE